MGAETKAGPLFAVGQKVVLRRTLRSHLGKDLVAGEVVIVDTIGDAGRTPLLRRYKVLKEYHWAWAYELDLASPQETLF
jgi:hypothetical protein